MEQQKSRAAARSLAMSSVQALELGGRRRQQLVISGCVLSGRVGPVGSESKADIPIGVRQVVHFEAPHLLRDGLGRCEEGRHHDQRPQPSWNAVTQLQPR
jgi:hypothetical protein